MTIFGPGLMRERTTRRAVAGSVVQVLEPGTDLPVETAQPVVTDVDGYYSEFETVPDIQHVYLRVGSHVQHAVAVGVVLTDIAQAITATPDGNGYLDLGTGA